MSENPCPVCRTPVPWEGNSYRPFCSRRCQLLDLEGWFGERHRISLDRQEDDEEFPEGNS